MRTGGPDLEPVVDDDVLAERAVPVRRSRGWWPSIGAASVLVLGAMTGVLLVRTASLGNELEALRIEQAAARDAVASASTERTRLEATIERIEAVNDAEDREHQDAVRFLSTDEAVLRDPIVVPPPGTRLCAASDLELLRPGFLALANRSGKACVLLDHPVVQGLDERGVWRTIPVVHSAASSYTDGPTWTGSFDPRFTAVLGMRTHAIDPRIGHCVTGEAPIESFSALRLVLAGQREPLVVPDVSFELGPCRPTLLLWAYDSTDI